jgi:hypothetical protein
VEWYFSEEIACQVPWLLRILACLYAACGIIAVILVPHKRRTTTKTDMNKPLTVAECWRDKTIYLLLLITLLAATYGIYMISAFKIFGMI